MITRIRVALLATSALLVFGCQAKLLQTATHAPTSPADIKLYQKEPEEYEILGIVQVKENLRSDEGTEITPIVNALKAKAAAMGANGLLFAAESDPRTTVRIVGRYDNEFYQIPYQLKPTKVVLAKAIWIPPKKD